MRIRFWKKRPVVGARQYKAGFPVYSLVALLALVVIIVGGGAEIHYRQRRHMRQNAFDTLTAISNIKVAEIVKWRQDMMSYGRLFGRSPIIQSSGAGWMREGGVDTAALRTHLAMVRENYHYRDIFLAGKDGHVFLGEAKRTPEPDSVPEEAMPFFKAVMETGEVQTSDLIASDTYGGPVMYIVTPLGASGSGNAAVGAMVMVVDPHDYLYPLVQKWPLPSASSETLLVRRDGNYVLFLNNLRFAPSAAMRLSIPLSRKDLPAVMAVEGKRGIVSGRDYRGEPVVAALAAVPDSDWLMVAKVDESEIYAPMRRWLAGIVFVVVLLAGLVASLVFSNWQRMQKARAREFLERETVHRRIEEKLRQVNAYAAKLLEASTAIIVALDPIGRITNWNVAAEEASGYGRDEVMGKNFFEIFAPKYLYPDVHNEFLQLLSGGGSERFENPIRTKDGEERYILWRNSPLSEYGVCTGIISFGIDITDRKRAEDGLKEAYSIIDKANKSKADFLAHMSHEIRTPLNAIIGFAQVIEEQAVGVNIEKYQEYAKDIHTSGQHLLSLVNDILDLSKVDAGKMELSRKKLSMEQIVSETMKVVQMVARDKGVALDVAVPSGLPPVYGDVRSLKQVLLNLLSNAIKFTAPGGQVSVTAHLAEKQIHVLVRDTGCGMSEEEQARIFQPYTQGNIMVSHSFGGTGLGLVISRKLMQLQGGDLSLASKQGEGTTLHMSIPVAPATMA